MIWHGICCSTRLLALFFRQIRKITRPREGKKKMLSSTGWGDGVAFFLQQRLDLPVPAWATQPPLERTEWLNKCVAQLWPFLSGYMLTVLKNKVESEIRNSMPTLLKSFHFLDVDLGDRPIRIQGVRVHTAHVQNDEIFVDVEIVYEGIFYTVQFL